MKQQMLSLNSLIRLIFLILTICAFFGHLLNAVKKYDQAVDAYMQAITLSE